MTPVEFVEAVYQRFRTQWGATTQVHYDGHAFTEPGPDVEWVRVSVQNLGGGQSTLGQTGGRKFERSASIFVQVFTPVTAGVGRGASLAQTARAIFEGTRLDPEAWCFDGVLDEQPVRNTDKSRQVNVEISSAYLETK